MIISNATDDSRRSVGSTGFSGCIRPTTPRIASSRSASADPPAPGSRLGRGSNHRTPARSTRRTIMGATCGATYADMRPSATDRSTHGCAPAIRYDCRARHNLPSRPTNHRSPTPPSIPIDARIDGNRQRNVTAGPIRLRPLDQVQVLQRASLQCRLGPQRAQLGSQTANGLHFRLPLRDISGRFGMQRRAPLGGASLCIP